MFKSDLKFWQKAAIYHPHDDKKFLALRRSFDDPSRPGKWDLVGGGVDFGELAELGLRREIKEEAGIEIKDIQPIYVFSRFLTDIKMYELFIGYRCIAKSENIILSKEHSEFLWATKEEFLQLESAQYLINMVEKLD